MCEAPSDGSWPGPRPNAVKIWGKTNESYAEWSLQGHCRIVCEGCWLRWSIMIGQDKEKHVLGDFEWPLLQHCIVMVLIGRASSFKKIPYTKFG